MFAQIIGDGGPWFLDEISWREAHSYAFNYYIFIKNVGFLQICLGVYVIPHPHHCASMVVNVLLLPKAYLIV